MSHSQNNLSCIPKARRRRLTFAVTVSAPTGKTLPQWQEFIRSAIALKVIEEEKSLLAESNIVVKLLRTETTYGDGDE